MEPQWRPNDKGYWYRYKGGVKQYLHRYVWEQENGPIPRGWHVHHKDHDRSNNDPDNLVAMPAGKHMEYHYEEYTSRTDERQCASCGATVYRKQRGGRAFQCRRCTRRAADRKRSQNIVVCEVCGTEFTTRAGRFCSQRCVNLGRSDRL